MRMITIMGGVRAGNRHNLEHAALCRTEKGRLVVVGDVIDLFDLLKWIDENPLTQFREVTKMVEECDVFVPPAILVHLFTPEGKVI